MTSDLSAPEPQVAAAWIAILGTLLGAIIGGGLQTLLAKRTVDATRKESAAQRGESRHLLHVQLHEERFKRLWSERYDLFRRVLDTTNQWTDTLRDLRDLDLTHDPSLEGTHVRTLDEARTLSPVAATSLEHMSTFRNLVTEADLLSDSEVRGGVHHLHQALLHAAQLSIEGEDGMSEVTTARDLTLLAMRRELIYGSGEPTDAPKSARKG